MLKLNTSSPTSALLLGPCCCLPGTAVKGNNQWPIPVDTIHFFLMSLTWTPGKQHTSLWVWSSCHMEGTPFSTFQMGRWWAGKKSSIESMTEPQLGPPMSNTQCCILALDFAFILLLIFHQATGISAGLQGQSVTLFHAAELLFPPNTSTSQVTEVN